MQNLGGVRAIATFLSISYYPVLAQILPDGYLASKLWQVGKYTD
ncbi:MAG: hypothetical protein RIM23_23835 [Coleofasciculus sp. G3-WIS-01]